MDLLAIDPLSLPSVPLLQYSQLPKKSAVYFVLSAEGHVLYIGSSVHTSNRWNNHHRWLHFASKRDVRIAYLECDNSKLLPEIEASLTKRFQPVFNGRSSNMKKLCSVAAGSVETEPGFKIDVDSPQWLKWLETAQSFRYCPTTTDTPYTARREKDYWYAYRKSNGKLHKRYIGKTEDLTMSRLDEIASLLNVPTQPRQEQVTELLSNQSSVTQYATNDDVAQLWEAITALRQEVVALGKLKAR